MKSFLTLKFCDQEITQEEVLLAGSFPRFLNGDYYTLQVMTGGCCGSGGELHVA